MSLLLERAALLETILDEWRDNSAASAATVAANVGVSRSTVHRAVRELKAMGSLEVVRVGAQTTYKVKRGVVSSIGRGVSEIQGVELPHDADEGLSCLLRPQAW